MENYMIPSPPKKEIQYLEYQFRIRETTKTGVTKLINTTVEKILFPEVPHYVKLQFSPSSFVKPNTNRNLCKEIDYYSSGSKKQFLVEFSFDGTNDQIHGVHKPSKCSITELKPCKNHFQK